MRFPQEMPCLLRIYFKDGSQVVTEKSDYEGFHSKPITWDAAVRKFEILGIQAVDSRLCKDIVQAVADLENIRITELTELLGAAPRT